MTRAFRPVPMTGRFPGFRVITAPRLLTFAMAFCGVALRFTVTRSYRTFTCFPFTPRYAFRAFGGTCHFAYFVLLYSSTIPEKCKAFSGARGKNMRYEIFSLTRCYGALVNLHRARREWACSFRRRSRYVAASERQDERKNPQSFRRGAHWAPARYKVT